MTSMVFATAFHCAMLRGHKDCMLEMHKRGIGDEYSAVGELFQCAMLRRHKDCMMEMHKRGIGSEYSPMGCYNTHLTWRS